MFAVGVVSAYLLGTVINRYNFRLILGIGFIPPIVQFLLISRFEETPEFLY